jgi:hypothetical protein
LFWPVEGGLVQQMPKTLTYALPKGLKPCWECGEVTQRLCQKGFVAEGF